MWVRGISLSSGEFCAWSPSYNFRACNGILCKTAVQIHGSYLLTFPRHCVRFQCEEPGSAALRGGAWLLQTKGMEDSMPPALSLEQMLGGKQATKRWFLDDNFMQQRFHRSSRSASFLLLFLKRASPSVPCSYRQDGKAAKDINCLVPWQWTALRSGTLLFRDCQGCPDVSALYSMAQHLCRNWQARVFASWLGLIAFEPATSGRHCRRLQTRERPVMSICEEKAFCSFFPDYFEGQWIY